MADVQVALILGFAGAGGGEPLGDGEGGAVVGGGAVAGGERKVAQLIVADAQVALVWGDGGDVDELGVQGALLLAFGLPTTACAVHSRRGPGMKD